MHQQQMQRLSTLLPIWRKNPHRCGMWGDGEEADPAVTKKHTTLNMKDLDASSPSPEENRLLRKERSNAAASLLAQNRTPISITWQDLMYTVPMPKVKGKGKGKGKPNTTTTVTSSSNAAGVASPSQKVNGVSQADAASSQASAGLAGLSGAPEAGQGAGAGAGKNGQCAECLS